MKTALSGATGRMGKALQNLIKQTEGFQVTDQAHRGRLPSCWDPTNIEAVIDFSLPPLFSETLTWCVTHQKPLVSGTTGLSVKQTKSLREAGGDIPVFYAANMSWGIWLMKSWIQSLNKAPPHFQIILEDIHHKNKKDSPGGTAVSLHRALRPAVKKKTRLTCRREGRKPGTHRLILKGENEELLLQHKALDRRLFAQGALKALKWLMKGRAPGLYSMEHICKP